MVKTELEAKRDGRGMDSTAGSPGLPVREGTPLRDDPPGAFGSAKANIAPRPVVSVRRMAKTRQGGAGYCLMVSSLKVFPGERLALVGQSGCGKSTLLDMLGLVLRPDMGRPGSEFRWRRGGKGEVVDVLASWRSGDDGRRERIRREDIGYVLQSGGLLPFLTVRDNILLPARLKGSPRGDELEGSLSRLAVELGIGHLLKKYPGSVSMGERQRAAVARALIHRPAIIIADEPTASLDPPTAAKVFDLMLRLSEGIPLVVSTHDRPRVEGLGFKIREIRCLDLVRGGIKAVLSFPEGSGPPSLAKGTEPDRDSESQDPEGPLEDFGDADPDGAFYPER
ncbi:MAG: ATP-binding cassette domain-containing protein [Deltaproteobacteria bacterium]|jgi:putative ABC transport system ATP-binding protein|nr:ATP-binding cassette domain-containing protein [Deltaproteobacteria bacterium]